MATVYIEQKRRETLKAMFQRVCEAVSDPSKPGNLSWSRTELFNTDPKNLSHTEKGFQMRTLERLCKHRVFKKVKEPGTNTYRYEVVDGDRILHALESEESFSGLIWAKSEKPTALIPEATSAPTADEPESGGIDSTDSPSEPPREDSEGGAPSSSQVQEAILKMVFGLVENMHYMRTKLETIETHLRELKRASPTAKAN